MKASSIVSLLLPLAAAFTPARVPTCPFGFAQKPAFSTKDVVAEEDTTSILARIGGEPALAAAVDILYERLVADDKLRTYFEGISMKSLKGMQRSFLKLALTEIPDDLDVADYLIKSHARSFSMGLDGTDFDAVAGHLVGTLESLGVTADLVDEVVAVVGPLRACFENGGVVATSKDDA
jgi:hemoglobin